MAGLNIFVTSGECALIASSSMSILQIKAPTNQRLVIKKISLMGKQAAGGTDAVVRYRLTRNSANFGTFTGTATTGKMNPSDGETLQGTYNRLATTEPTTPTDTGMLWEWSPQIGAIDDLSLDKWIEVPGGQSVQIEALSTGTPTVVATCVVEE